MSPGAYPIWKVTKRSGAEGASDALNQAIESLADVFEAAMIAWSKPKLQKQFFLLLPELRPVDL